KTAFHLTSSDATLSGVNAFSEGFELRCVTIWPNCGQSAACAGARPAAAPTASAAAIARRRARPMMPGRGPGPSGLIHANKLAVMTVSSRAARAARAADGGSRFAAPSFNATAPRGSPAGVRRQGQGEHGHVAVEGGVVHADERDPVLGDGQ